MLEQDRGNDRTLERGRAAFGWDGRQNISSSETGSCKREGNGNFFLHLISLGISGAEKVLRHVPEFCELQRRRQRWAEEETEDWRGEEKRERKLEPGDVSSVDGLSSVSASSLSLVFSSDYGCVWLCVCVCVCLCVLVCCQGNCLINVHYTVLCNCRMNGRFTWCG